MSPEAVNESDRQRPRFEAPGIGGKRSSSVTERMIEANGVELCTEAFGHPPDPPILLIGGIGASMLWWEEDFCRMLAGARGS
jgi:hypothetical protein